MSTPHPDHASIVAAVLEHARRSPERLALTFEGEHYTYGRLARMIAGYAGALRGYGIVPGDHIALFRGNSPDFLAAYLGTHLAGGTVVLVNPQYRQGELLHILADAAVRLCWTEPALRSEIERVRAELPELERIVDVPAEPAAELPDSTTFPLPQPDATAAIAYTSGTTGRSKGALLLHRNQTANISAVCAAWSWTAADHLLLTLPLFHVHGLMVGAHGTLLQGASMELRRGFDAAEVYAALQGTDNAPPPTMFFGVPTMYTRLIAEFARHTAPPRQLRLWVAGSAPLSAHTLEEFERWTGQRILERYGMTETLMSLGNPLAGERRAGTVGQPFPGQQARIVDVRTRAPLPPDSDGEIEVRGPNVFPGYWQRPDATAESFTADGWFRTGDLGRVSADGYFMITGRAKELIITGGYNVYPREIEDLLAQCPGVVEAAVLGLPDAEFGEQVVAVVVRSDPGLTETQVVAFCREQLAGYKKPRRVVFAPSLPRNALGKVQKHVLADELR